MRFWISSIAFILAEIASLAESQCRRCDQSITGKGPFIYYVSTFLGFLDPPPPVCKHVFSTVKLGNKELSGHPKIVP